MRTMTFREAAWAGREFYCACVSLGTGVGSLLGAVIVWRFDWSLLLFAACAVVGLLALSPADRLARKRVAAFYDAQLADQREKAGS